MRSNLHPAALLVALSASAVVFATTAEQSYQQPLRKSVSTCAWTPRIICGIQQGWAPEDSEEVFPCITEAQFQCRGRAQ